MCCQFKGDMVEPHFWVTGQDFFFHAVICNMFLWDSLGLKFWLPREMTDNFPQINDPGSWENTKQEKWKTIMKKKKKKKHPTHRHLMITLQKIKAKEKPPKESQTALGSSPPAQQRKEPPLTSQKPCKHEASTARQSASRTKPQTGILRKYSSRVNKKKISQTKQWVWCLPC